MEIPYSFWTRSEEDDARKRNYFLYAIHLVGALRSNGRFMMNIYFQTTQRFLGLKLP